MTGFLDLDLLVTTLMSAVVYAFLGAMLLGITMPLWMPVLSAGTEALSKVFDLYARFEDWRDHRAAGR